MGFKEFAKDAVASIKRNSPRILTALGIGGYLTTTVLAVKATPEAMRCIEEEKKRLNKRHLTPQEIIRCTWKCYIWSVVTAGASTGCVIAAVSKYEGMNTALATALSIGDTIHREYRIATQELVGEEKEREIQDKAEEKRVQRAMEMQKDISNNPNFIESVKDGTTLCFFDGLPLDGKIFYIDLKKLDKAICKCNRSMSTSVEPYISVVDLLYEAEVPRWCFVDSIKILERLGWNMYTGFIDMEEPKEYETRVIFDETRQPGTVKCYRLKFTLEGSPRYDYQKY